VPLEGEDGRLDWALVVDRPLCFGDGVGGLLLTLRCVKTRQRVRQFCFSSAYRLQAHCCERRRRRCGVRRSG